MTSSEKKPVRELLRFWTSWEMLIIQGVSVAIVVFSPDDVLTQYPMLSEFVDVVARWFPPLSAQQRVSEFPQVTGLYFSVMYFVTPLILFQSPRAKNEIFKGGKNYDIRPIRYWVAAVMCCAFCLLSPFFLYLWDDAKDELLPSTPIRSSKLWLAVLGWTSAGGWAWLTISHTMWIPIFAVGKILKIKLRD
ncbi:hypothetical protein WKR88_00055 [Trinickia caryophylli]|uniref:Uncharacterized protein n=1 Tax=Trinickia caryophylli TaxID=28094 RepID=A0A1X7D057_TRICW|nr:hypothetical protein [Trinickia caryophylli]TRX13624.1 hypothetical protein FNF07_19650 [Trinickia caryophylli]WQE15202.1 hypothetical protein U0034_21880 [Trinickia caryophylli]SMF05920.1 hypothetical protein SAMN06295900_102183 [Trinickia caryophylli]